MEFGNLLSALAVIAVGVLAFTWFLRGATSGVGRRYRLAQMPYYRVGSLENFAKSGERFASAAAAAKQQPKSWFERLVHRLAPSEANWFASRFPTDKGGHHDYLSVYDELFAPYRERGGVWLLEVGVKKGGSLVLWRELFDAGTFVYGIDVNPDVPRFSRDGHMKVLILDSRSRRQVDAALGGLRFDIIIDDGLHLPDAQFQTFQALVPYLSPTGLYIIEDVVAIDPERYRAHGFDVRVIPDRSGQSLAVLCPPASLALTVNLPPGTRQAIAS